MNKIVLDTSVLIALERSDLKLSEVFTADNYYYLPHLVAAEFLVGAETAKNPKMREFRLAFLRTIEAICQCESFDKRASREFARLRASSKLQGKNKEKFDLAIGATAAVLQATLLTRDSNFAKYSLPGLTIRVI